MTTTENWRRVNRVRDNFREEIHKKRWFEGVGISKDENGDWCLLLSHKPGTEPKIPKSFDFEGVGIRTQEKLVKSSSKNQGKTEYQKAKKKAQAAARKEAKDNPKPKTPWKGKKSSAPKKAQPKKTEEESAVEMPSRFKF